jgi:radical SAM protein with 4Fe4S-binding SPASM domain
MIPASARIFDVAGQGFDPDKAPFTVAWEITRACPLKCRHCRADAQPLRNPDELTTSEGIALLQEAASGGVKVFVITGGDPLARPDVFDLIDASKSAGMHTAFSPSVTARLTQRAMARAYEAGTDSIHLSLDGASAETHDGMRGVKGSFRKTIEAIRQAAEFGWRMQIGTTVCKTTLPDIFEMPRLLSSLVPQLTLWTLFFLVPTGRAQQQEALSPSDQEKVLEWLADGSFPFPVRTIAAPTYRRILVQRGRSPGAPINDGKGFAFVSHTGDVCPSGFLQLPAGNVRCSGLLDTYRHSQLFKDLREPSKLHGKCGVCEYKFVCGGSRARAYAAYGDPLAEDPSCPWIPETLRGQLASEGASVARTGGNRS